jgi:hypothetical protein
MLDPLATPCPFCGLCLRSAVLENEAMRFVVYYHEGQRVERCPRCSQKLDGNAVKPRHVPHDANP